MNLGMNEARAVCLGQRQMAALSGKGTLTLFRFGTFKEKKCSAPATLDLNFLGAARASGQNRNLATRWQSSCITLNHDQVRQA
jgi:hypothetical protein